MNFKFLRKEIISGNASVKEIINEYFSKIDDINPKINAYICTTRDLAQNQANEIDKLIQSDEQLPPLAGLPIAIKDNWSFDKMTEKLNTLLPKVESVPQNTSLKLPKS